MLTGTLSAMTTQEIPALVAGSLLILFGAGSLWRHVATRKAAIVDPELSDEDRVFSRNQFRRRVQTSGLICLIGFLILVGDLVIPWGRNGRGDKVAATFWFAIYWSGIIILALWVILLALGDFAAIRTNSRGKLSRLEAARRSLQREAERLRSEQDKRSLP